MYLIKDEKKINVVVFMGGGGVGGGKSRGLKDG